MYAAGRQQTAERVPEGMEIQLAFLGLGLEKIALEPSLVLLRIVLCLGDPGSAGFIQVITQSVSQMASYGHIEKFALGCFVFEQGL
nr:hypothetical protein [Anaerohalosphaera lusitana]